MGSTFITGPLIRFGIDEGALRASLTQALGNAQQQIAGFHAQTQQQIKTTGENIARQMISPALEATAKLRAAIAQENLGVQQVVAERKKIINLVQAEISVLSAKDSLGKQELSRMKQLTLELERQKSFLAGGGGITTGTSSVLNQLMSGLRARIGGFSALPGGGFGVVSLSEPLGKIAEEAGGATAAIGGLAAVAIATAGALNGLAIGGGQLVKELDIVSQKTGISRGELQLLQAVGRTVNVGLDDVVVGFRKFSKALVDASHPEASAEAAKFAKVLGDMGVKSREPIEALRQVADAFARLPDGAVKADAAVFLFGRSGLNLIPILNQGSAGIDKFRQTVLELGPEIDASVIAATQQWEAANVGLHLSFERIKVDLARDLLPNLSHMIDFATKALSLMDEVIARGLGRKGDVVSQVQGALRATGKQFTTEGLDLFKEHIARLNEIDLEKALANPQRAMREFQRLAQEVGVSYDRLVTNIAAGTGKAGESSGAFANKLGGDLAAGADKAAKGLSKLEKAIEDYRIHLASFERSPVTGLLMPRLPSKADFDAALKRADESIAQKLFGISPTAVSTAGKDVEDAILKSLEKTNKDAIDTINTLLGLPVAEVRDKGVKALEDLNKKWIKDTETAVGRINAEYDRDLESFRLLFYQKAITEQEFNKASVELEQIRQAELKRLRDEDARRIKQEAGQLFDALITGTHNFAQALRKTLLGIVLAPVRRLFQEIVYAIFSPLEERIKHILGLPTTPGTGRTGLGGIFGGIFGGVGPGGTPPFFPGHPTIAGSPTLQTGSATLTTARTDINAAQASVQAGQATLTSPQTALTSTQAALTTPLANLRAELTNATTPLMNVTAATVNIVGSPAAGGSKFLSTLGGLFELLRTAGGGGSGGGLFSGLLGLFGGGFGNPFGVSVFDALGRPAPGGGGGIGLPGGASGPLGRLENILKNPTLQKILGGGALIAGGLGGILGAQGTTSGIIGGALGGASIAGGVGLLASSLHLGSIASIALSPWTLGLSAVAGAIFGGLIGHHHAAVKKENETLGRAQPKADQAIAQIMSAVQTGQMSPEEGAVALDKVVADFLADVQGIIKMDGAAGSSGQPFIGGHCNAACVIYHRYKDQVAELKKQLKALPSGASSLLKMPEAKSFRFAAGLGIDQTFRNALVEAPGGIFSSSALGLSLSDFADVQAQIPGLQFPGAIGGRLRSGGENLLYGRGCQVPGHLSPSPFALAKGRHSARAEVAELLRISPVDAG